MKIFGVECSILLKNRYEVLVTTLLDSIQFVIFTDCVSPHFIFALSHHLDDRMLMIQ
jgi:hypothetical protein